MKNLNIIVLLLTVSLFFISCEREIDIDLPDAESKLVVDGSIFLGEYAEVVLTKSSGFFSAVNESSILDLLVTDAVVVVNSNGIDDTLQQTFDASKFPPIFFKGNTLIGTEGQDYSLTIIYDGETYNANTTILPLVPLDSLWFKRDNPNSNLGFVWARFSDPPELGNCYRIFTKRIGQDDRFYTPLRSVVEDKFFNGQTFDFPISRGQRPNSENEEDQFPEAGFFRIGEEVVIKFTTLTFESYDFFRGVDFEAGNNGNPFASPTFINSTISNGAFGHFTGYGVFADTLLIQ